MTTRLSSTKYVYILGLLSNLLVAYVIFYQISKTNTLNELWQNQTRANIELALQLKEIERVFGYVGFIHHFKNYIIRGEEVYFERSQASYRSVKDAISKARQIGLSQLESKLVDEVEKTIDLYYSKLLLAQIMVADAESIQALDKALRVDDSDAEAALVALRENILPRLTMHKAETEHKLSEFNQLTVSGGLLLITFVLMFSALALINIKRSSSLASNLNAIFDAAPDGIISIDDKGNVMQSNEAARIIFGYSSEEFEKLRVEDLVEKKEREKHIQAREAFLSSPSVGNSPKVRSDQRIFRGLKKDGKLVPVGIAISEIMTGLNVKAVCLIKDMTHELELKEASEFDHLTKLNNRRHFDLVLRREIERASREHSELTLMLIDVDNFKALNDTHGHEAGDRALKVIADFLKSHIRNYDHVARWGGDEFTLLCPNLSKSGSLQRAKKLCNEFKYIKLDVEHDLSLSIGVALFSDTDEAPESLLKKADSAVYSAKRSGKNQVHLYHASN